MPCSPPALEKPDPLLNLPPSHPLLKLLSADSPQLPTIHFANPLDRRLQVDSCLAPLIVEVVRERAEEVLGRT